MSKPLAEKIGVIAMFILVMVVFSMAQRDTQKIIQQDSITAGKKHYKQDLASSKQQVHATPPLLTRN